MKKTVSLLLIVLGLTTALYGCKGGKNNSELNSNAGPQYGGSIVVGVQNDIDSLDPHLATSAGTKEILFNIYEGLVKSDENGNLIPAVASDYKVSSDGKVYTFTLRDGIKFHNGNPVTVEDVKYSLERCCGLLDGVVLNSSLKTIESVKIVDQKTVEVTLESANSEMICYFTSAIIPKGVDTAKTPVGTGPFKFESYSPQEKVVLAKNDNYWISELPYLDTVTFRIVSNSDSAVMFLKSGGIDMFSYLTDDQVLELQDSHQILTGMSDTVQALFINNAVEPYNDVRVRQAISYAIDTKAIVEYVSGGKGTAIGAPMTPALERYYADYSNAYALDVAKAKSLLAEAGYPNGFTMKLTYPTNYQFHIDTATIIADQLKAANITVELVPVEWATWLSDVYTGRQYETTVCAVTANLAPSYLVARFESTSSKNFVNYNSATFDAAFKLANNTTDDNVKIEQYKKIQQIISEDAASTFIQVAPLNVALSKNYAGYKFYPIYVQDMSTVYKVN